jgi:hypothetical protein
VRLEGLGKLKKFTSSGFDSATIRLVAQCLNQLRYRVPLNYLYLYFIYFHLVLVQGRAIAQAVSRWLSTTAARVRSRVWSSGICCGQSGSGAGFLRVFRFPLPIFIPPISGRRAEWTQLDSTPPPKRIKKKNYRFSR